MFAVKCISMEHLRTFSSNPVNLHVIQTFQERRMLKTECKNFTYRRDKYSLIKAVSSGYNRNIKLVRSMRPAATCNSTEKNTWTTLDRVSSVEDCTLIKVAVPYQNRQKMVGRSFAKVFGQVLVAVDLKQAWLKCLATEIDMQTFTRRHCCPFQDAVVITIKAAGLFITLQWVFWEKLRAVVDY